MRNYLHSPGTTSQRLSIHLNLYSMLSNTLWCVCYFVLAVFGVFYLCFHLNTCGTQYADFNHILFMITRFPIRISGYNGKICFRFFSNIFQTCRFSQRQRRICVNDNNTIQNLHFLFHYVMQVWRFINFRFFGF